MSATVHSSSQTAALAAAAREEMLAHGLDPDFPPGVEDQLKGLRAGLPKSVGADGVRDLRMLAWSSIDNPESRDLDQVEYVEQLSDGSIRLLVGIADVDALVAPSTPIDTHAAKNTTSVYMGVTIFPMLPEALSTDLTSLVFGQDRAAHVVELTVGADGTVTPRDAYRAVLCNKAKLDYETVGAWLAGHGPVPAPIHASAELQAQLRLQHDAASRLKTHRYAAGALNIDSIEPRAVMANGNVVDIAVVDRNAARDLIEEFMIAANISMAEILKARGVSMIRRVVRQPKRWDGIVKLAHDMGDTLPDQPDGRALSAFLTSRRAADPEHFPDLSLTIVKLLGPGEYVVERATDPVDAGEHFGLAVAHYVHSTAPNRRFADLVVLRLSKATEAKAPAPYADEALAAIAAHCTEQERQSDAAERTMRKRIAATVLANRIGETFAATVTGKSDKGTFVRVFKPPVEGMLVHGGDTVDVGDTLTVRLTSTDPQRGFIDFAANTANAKDLTRKLDRARRKRGVAEQLRRYIGVAFDATVTGSGPSGVWVRLTQPPAGIPIVEGRVMRGGTSLKVGDHSRVRLVSTNPIRGFVDFDTVTADGAHANAGAS